MSEEIQSTKVRSGGRTYFFDVKKASNDSLYLEITESRKKSDGTFERHNIMIFQEDIKAFKYEIVGVYEKYFENK